MTISPIKTTALIAAAFAATLALTPNNAEAASKTGYFVGGVAAGVGGLLLLDAAHRSHGYYGRGHYAPHHYAPRRYAPRYYAPARACRTTGSILRKIRRNHGFSGFHNIRYRSSTIKMRAWRHGGLYRLKASNCNGRLIWSQAI